MNVHQNKDSLETPITEVPTSTAARTRLLELLWGACPIGCVSTPYFEYYAQQCDSFFIEQSEYCTISNSADGHVTTHQELADIAGSLVAGSRTKEDVIGELLAAKALPNASAAHENIKNSVNWAARALTCTEIGTLRCAFSSRRPLLWESGSLRDFMADVFSANKLGNVQVRLEKTFNACNLERLAGIAIEWTNDLSSHLSLREDDTKVLIFHQATFLESVHQ